MGEKPHADWAGSLGDIERSIADCLQSLDHYEAKFEALLYNPTPAAGQPAEADDLDQWRARFRVAEAEVERVEKMIVEHEEVWREWRRSFGDWKKSVERVWETSPTSTE